MKKEPTNMNEIVELNGDVPLKEATLFDLYVGLSTAAILGDQRSLEAICQIAAETGEPEPLTAAKVAAGQAASNLAVRRGLYAGDYTPGI